MIILMKMVRNSEFYFSSLYRYTSDLYFATRVNQDSKVLKDELLQIQKKIIKRFSVPETNEEMLVFKEEFPEAYELFEQTASHIAHLTVEPDAENL